VCIVRTWLHYSVLDNGSCKPRELNYTTVIAAIFVSVYCMYILYTFHHSPCFATTHYFCRKLTLLCTLNLYLVVILMKLFKILVPRCINICMVFCVISISQWLYKSNREWPHVELLVLLTRFNLVTAVPPLSNLDQNGVELSIRWKSAIHSYIPSTINLEIFLGRFSKTM